MSLGDFPRVSFCRTADYIIAIALRDNYDRCLFDKIKILYDRFDMAVSLDTL